ncbi:MAG: hypothetical protein GY862_25250 [Gammaproteobacteria bacterium]|nr:hypothetical protein [Gammaproteobacteria bacterium]
MSIDAALVRLFSGKGKQRRYPVGAGFLATPRHVLTCAHVVEDVLGLRRYTPEKPATQICLDFALLPEHEPFVARVIAWFPVPEQPMTGKPGDIAVLEFGEDILLPTGAQPIPLVVLPDFQDRAVTLCGFPHGMPDGDRLNGTLMGAVADGRVQMDNESGQRTVAGGFSGTPVWDKREKAVAGITVSIHDRDNIPSAYMIPAIDLVKAWPPLDKESRPLNPYRGLEAFREQDAVFFFGREAVVEELTQLVADNPFVSVLGASGSGKSSLVFAGLAPRLRKSGDWLIVSFRPRGQPFEELARALLPLLYNDILAQLQKLTEFSRSLRDGDIGLWQVARLVLQEHPGKRLLIIADQFEEIYTLNSDKTLQQRFMDVFNISRMPSLQGSLSPPFEICLLLTMRADFMGQAAAYAPFAETLDTFPAKILGPMDPQGLLAAIEKPAEKQSVKLEPGLAETILKDLGDEPGNLPLLEFALAWLWEQQTRRLLTHAAYRDIGGVQQALARHADTVYQGFSFAQQKLLRRIFVQLVRPGEGTEDTRQVAVRPHLPADSWGLVKELADERLVVTGNSSLSRRGAEEDFTETVEVIHEALIRHWQPLRQWMHQDRAFRVWQNNLRQAIRNWENAGGDKDALLRGTRLTEAGEKLDKELLNKQEEAFIRAGIAQREKENRANEQTQQEREEQHKRIIWVTVVALIVALLLSGEIFLQLKRVEKARDDAIKEKQRANKEKDNALRTQSLFLVHQGKQKLKEHKPLTAMRLALEALPGSSETHPERPLAEQAHALLYQVAAHWGNFLKHKDGVDQAEFSPDGTLLLTRAGDNVYLWDARTYELRRTLQGHQCENLAPQQSCLTHAAFSSNGSRVLTASLDNTARLWDTQSGQSLLVFKGHKNYVLHAVFSPDESQVLTASEDGTARLWDAQNGQLLFALKGHNGSVLHAAFSLDGSRVITASHDTTARLWDVRNGRVLLVLPEHGDSVYHAAFSPDGTRVLTACRDTNARLWNAQNGKLLRVEGHDSSVVHAAFSSDGSRVFSVSHSGTVLLWDIQTGQPPHTLQESNGTNGRRGVLHATFSPNGHRVLVASDDKTARLWDARTGKSLLVLKGHESFVTYAAFSHDGARIITASDDETARVWDARSGQSLYYTCS